MGANETVVKMLLGDAADEVWRHYGMMVPGIVSNAVKAIEKHYFGEKWWIIRQESSWSYDAAGFTLTIDAESVTATDEKTGERFIVRLDAENFYGAVVELAQQVGMELEDG